MKDLDGSARLTPSVARTLRHLGFLPAICAATLQAQATTDSTVAACDGLRVVAVELRPEAPAVIDRSAPRWARPILRVALQSRRTEPSAVQPYVLPSEGETCTEFERAETERLLRAQPYLAEAHVRAVPEGDGVRLVVETTDDIPLILGIGLHDGSPSRVLFGNANVMGLGMLAAAEWERGFAYREGFGAHLEHYHVLGRRQVASLHAVRAPLSASYEAELARPYLTAAQNFAWAAGYTRAESYLSFPHPGDPSVSMSTTRELWGASALARVGGRTRRLLAGGSVGYETGRRDADGVIITDTGFVTEPDTPFGERYQPFSTTSIAAIVGTRLLSFVPMMGLDARAGRQDVASGVQLMTTLGYDLNAKRARADGGGDETASEPFAILDLYAGHARRRGLTALAFAVEGQRSADEGWQDVVTNGRVAWYAKPSDRRTHEASLEFMGAWQTRRPYRVTLSSRRGGVRGYKGSRAAGGRLAVLRLEERLATGGFGSIAGFGVAAFTDVGKLWEGDVPYGVTTSVRASAGAAFLVAVPRRSQGAYRIETAARLTHDPDADKWNLRISRVLPYATFLRESGDLARARRGRPASALISSP